MTYLVARLPLDSVGDGMITTYERRVYKPRDIFQEYVLVHYRILNTMENVVDSGDDAHEPGDGDGEGNAAPEEEGAVQDELDPNVGGGDADENLPQDPPAAPLYNGHLQERKKIIKAMKTDTGTSHVRKMASDQFGCMALACSFSIVDNTKLVTKIIVHDLEISLKDLVMDKNGRRPLLHLLQPNSSSYCSHDDLASLDMTVPSLMEKSETSSQTKDSDHKESGEEAKDDQEEIDLEENGAVVGGKKDPLLRRQELLVNSGLAERLIDVCVENTEEFLKSNIGKDVVYEVAMGGSGGIMCPSLSEKLSKLYEAITSVAAKPKPQEPEKNSEHVLENYQSRQTIRKLILDCPAFASTLFKNALSGNCRSWAQGHCAKILSAFLETQDFQVREMAREELQVLVKEGVLKI